MKRVLIVGAGSAIAQAAGRIFAARGDALCLAGRNRPALEAIAADLRVRGAKLVHVETLDLNAIQAHGPLLSNSEQALGGLDTVLIAHGTLSDQPACEHSVDLTIRELTTNGVSVVALLTLIANRFERQRSGAIAVISSVAGDRGRRSNYVYGSAKALVTAFLSGLRQRLRKSAVAVITIKPGFVDTPMTAAFPKGLLWASPQHVARGIVKAIDRSATVAYLPSFWGPVMLMIRAIPEAIFQRLNL
ncbi:MAG TPA: SDR family oxidoreductase [Steroidobacteraceae bacterium]|nr:SDR family oxidoreductase [Steroidobacteraceae bacterium]